MTYIINKTDGSVLVTLNDGTVDTSTDLVLVGKNYSGYGEYQNENFVKLLENFKNTSAPSTPLEGQIWYDSTNKALKVYNGTGFKLPPVATSSGSAPSNKNTGDLWYDSTNQQLNFWDGSAWKVIGPAYSASLGTTGDVYDTISDGVTSHPVIKKYLTGNLISVISKDAQFTPSPSLAGFATIRPGYNISSNYSMAVLENLYVTGDVNVTGSVNGNATSATSVNVTNTTTGTGPYYIAFVDGTSGNKAVRVDSSTLTYNATTNTLTATTFSGTATQAQYADLAERYESDDVYVPGTLVKIGGEKEVTRTIEENDIDIFGVVSTAPGFLLNAGAGDNKTHPPIALQGRVPVLVKGPVRKGQRLVSSNLPGIARAVVGAPSIYAAVLGRALESSEDEGVKLINSVIGIK